VPWAYYFVPQTGFITCIGFSRGAALLCVIWNVKISIN